MHTTRPRLVSRFAMLPAFAALLLASAAPTFAATDHGKHAEHAAASAALADGEVKRLDQANGRVTIAHGPLPNGMPAMTMPFALKDPVWFGKLREGQKVRFSIEDVKGVLTVRHIEAVK